MIATIRSRRSYLIPAVIIGIGAAGIYRLLRRFTISMRLLCSAFRLTMTRAKGFELVDTILFSRGGGRTAATTVTLSIHLITRPFFHIVIVPLVAVWHITGQGRLVSYRHVDHGCCHWLCCTACW